MTAHNARCQRCGSILVRVFSTEFPSCPACGWEDYSTWISPQPQLIGSSLAQLDASVMENLKGFASDEWRKTHVE